MQRPDVAWKVNVHDDGGDEGFELCCHSSSCSVALLKCHRHRHIGTRVDDDDDGDGDELRSIQCESWLG
jgi:hypothetical protein